jgi:hypothetical protein
MIGTKWRYNEEQRVQVYETFVHQKVAKLAEMLLPAVLTSDALKQHMSDDEIKLSPRKVAVLACDIAQAMYNEFESREWLLRFPEDAVK